MNWQNLKFMLCPYCSELLIDGSYRIKCSKCRFEQTREKFEFNKRRANGPFEWQNLLEDRCPVDRNLLIPNPDYAGGIICEHCEFKMLESTLATIKIDEDHPAHRYKKKIKPKPENLYGLH